jgi:hypothetical protein
MKPTNGGFFVATNRQKPPVNHFAERAARQRAAEEAAKAKAAKPIGPAPAAEPKPNLEALKAAAAEAAALVHAPETVTVDELPAELDPQNGVPLPEYDPKNSEQTSEGAEPKRGRPLSAAVVKRNATILQLLAENPEGLSKPQLASELKEKEANVYTSLRRLQSDGKVRMENTEGTKYLWYLV